MAHCAEEGSPRAPRPELAEILREHARELPRLSNDQSRVVSALIACRTATLGGHLQRCDHCGRESPLYNSCRNRHCPKCQSLDQALWVEAQAEDLLLVPYFHEVFTLPHCLNPFFLRNPRAAHRLLFDAAARTVIELCRSNLGANPGIIAVLHTWTQTLEHHPHIHCIATGGGLSLDGKRWCANYVAGGVDVRDLALIMPVDRNHSIFARRDPGCGEVKGGGVALPSCANQHAVTCEGGAARQTEGERGIAQEEKGGIVPETVASRGALRGGGVASCAAPGAGRNPQRAREGDPSPQQ